MPKIDAYLEALARFHVALEHAAGQASDEPARIGARKRERPVFTRRGILSVLEFLCSPLSISDGAPSSNAFRRSLVRYYLGRLADPADQKLVVELLTTTRPEQAADLARALEDENLKRQALERRMVAEARQVVAEAGLHTQPALVVVQPGQALPVPAPPFSGRGRSTPAPSC